MTSLVLNSPRPEAKSVQVSEDALIIELADGRTISAPLAWYPRLLQGTPEERKRYRLIGSGEGIHWPDLDEDISVDGVIAGRPSFETKESFQQWLASRASSKI